MRLDKKQNTTKTIVTVLALLSSVAVLAWLLVSQMNDSSVENSSDENSASVEPAPSTLDDDTVASKQSFIEQQTKQAADEDSEPDNSSSGLEMSTVQSGSSVTVSTKISSMGDGVCSLSISNGSKSYTREVEVIYQPSYSTCAGFTVPISELGSGEWDISITATSLSGTKVNSSKTLEVS